MLSNSNDISRGTENCKSYVCVDWNPHGMDNDRLGSNSCLIEMSRAQDMIM